MPAKVKVKVVAGRNLPVMDRGADTTDAFVELRLGAGAHKTDVCRKSLNPQWACAEWFRFEVDDADLQDEPLQLRLMDHDTYSANDAIGKVYISLNPLLLPLTHRAGPESSLSGKGAVMSGWIPVFDTMHGIRGEVKVIVKVELFNDFNKFRQSSCGVQFFHSPVIPQGYQVQVIHGFVEELVVNDDPEYQWIDKIRTPRASNEARQVAFLKLSGQVQRKIGLKALELGANAVIGFKRCLDLEGEVGVVARGTGTAVTLIRLQEHTSSLVPNIHSANTTSSPDPMQQSCVGSGSSPGHTRADSHGATANVNINISHRRSSDSDITGATPKDMNNLSSSKGRNEKFLMPAGRVEKFSMQGGSLTTGGVLRPSMNPENIDLLEYPFITIVKFPQGFIKNLGGSVTARSVKLLERVPNPEEPAPRDTWWSELRTEVRSHMRSLRCNAVLAYQEITTICDDVCVLSATGTAAVIDLSLTDPIPNTQLGIITDTNVAAKPQEHDVANRGELTQTTSLDRTDFEKNGDASNAAKSNSDSQTGRKRISERCGSCHLPYNCRTIPYKVSVTKCHICKKGRVPSVIMCTIEPVEGLSIIGRGCLVQAVACKVRSPGRGEPAARDISDQLPFLEYELHRLLLAKLRVRGMNAIFGLKTSISVGSNVVAAVGVGTGVLIEALGPCTGGPRLHAAPGDPKLVKALQRGLDDALHANKDVYHLHMEPETSTKPQPASETEESDEDLPDLDLGAGNKDACILEVDDAEDLEVLKMLTEARPPAGLHVVNTQSVPGLPASDTLTSIAHLQMFTQLWRARLNSPYTSLHPHFHRLLQTVYFKLRRMVPCAVCDLKFRLDLPESDEIQLVVTGMAFKIAEPLPEKAQISVEIKPDKETIETDDIKKSESNEMIFTLDEETAVDVNAPAKQIKSQIVPVKDSPVHASPNISAQLNPNWRPTVVMTPLATIPGGRILEYLGNLDFIFVRESTSVREQGGLSGFVHTFITEVLAIVRAHVTALSGNAIVAFYMTELILSDTPHKNQAQCLLSVGGDAVSVSYFTNE